MAFAELRRIMASQRAERADVTLAQSLFGSGIDLCKRGEFELAIAHLDRACELCPDDEDMQAARAQVRLLRSRHARADAAERAAAERAEREEQRASQNAAAAEECYALAMNAVEGNDLERALRLAEKAHRLDRRSLAISALLNSLRQALDEAEGGSEEEEWQGDGESEEEESEEEEEEEEGVYSI